MPNKSMCARSMGERTAEAVLNGSVSVSEQQIFP